MSETYPVGGQEETATGKVILIVVSALSAVLVLLGLAYATGTGQRHKEALAAAECEPNLSPSGLQCTTVQMLVSQFTGLVTPASQQLDADMAAYTANEGDHLGAAEAALTAEVTSEHALNASLAAFPFPPAVAPVATALIQASQARAKLTAEQARSTSLAQLRSFNHRAEVASAAVASEMRLVRKALNVPPTVAQES
jgi:hypothetical protein